VSVDASWELDEGVDDAVAVAFAEAALTTTSLFARGPLAPFQRDQKDDFANGVGAALLRTQVKQVVATRAAALDGSSYGDLEWDQGFGSQLHRVRHRRLNDALVELFRFFVVEPVRRFAPDTRVSASQIVLDKDRRASRVRIKVQAVDGRGAAFGPEIPVDLPIAGEATP
jgi:hypothetical protein